jgi:nifR3 family TIM-barrel protein
MNFWQQIDKPIIGLSPMDGVTDASFRFITAKHGGPDVTLTEFVNAENSFYAPQTLIKDLTYSEMERPAVAQVYGHTPEMFYKFGHIVCELGFDGLDINMGCPAKKVAARGSGAALILTPKLAQSIIRTARQGIQDWCEGQTLRELGIDQELIQMIRTVNRLRSGMETSPRRRIIPVSVKTRLGYDRIVVDEWIQTLLEEKPAAISLHGRTLKQKYTGSADWEAIARAVELSKNSGTLILGNGDLRDMRGVYGRIRESGVDGVLVGRATQGNPWIFRAKGQVKHALRSKSETCIDHPPVGLGERFQVILEHSKHFERHWGLSSFVGIRKHLAWYCKASPRASELRSRMVRLNNVKEVTDCLREYAIYLASEFEHDSRFMGTDRSFHPSSLIL